MASRLALWTTRTAISELSRDASGLYVPSAVRCAVAHPLMAVQYWRLQGKLLNCGQVCVAPDYVLVTRDAHDRLVKALKETVVQFYGENIQVCVCLRVRPQSVLATNSRCVCNAEKQAPGQNHQRTSFRPHVCAAGLSQGPST